MSKFGNENRQFSISSALKHLKTGDVFNVHSGRTTCQNFTVVGANIVHKTHPDLICTPNTPCPPLLILTSNYPFERRGGDTSLRYVIYAELTA